MTKETGTSASLGAGSFDYDKLYGDAASKVLELPAEERDAAMADHVRSVDQSNASEVDPRDTPGYKCKTVTRDGVKERIQVPDEAHLEDQQQSEQVEAIPAPLNAATKPAAAPKKGEK